MASIAFEQGKASPSSHTMVIAKSLIVQIFGRFGQAINQGNANARYNLGVLYDNSQDAHQDDDKVAK